MVVYIVFQGEYEDEHIEGVFAQRADAQKLADALTAKYGYFKNGQLVANGGFVVEWRVTPASGPDGAAESDQ